MRLPWPTAGWSAPVQVFGRRDDETIHALRRCFDGHVWTPIVSSGDVAVMVSRLRQRALVTGPMDEDRRMTCAINWDDWHESLRSDLLRRTTTQPASVRMVSGSFRP